MQNPSFIFRGLFLVSLGFLLVSVLFTIGSVPGAPLISCVGAVASLGFYAALSAASTQKRNSNYARHATFISIVVAIVLKSFSISIGAYFFLFAFVAFLVWFSWSVLEQLPRQSKE